MHLLLLCDFGGTALAVPRTSARELSVVAAKGGLVVRLRNVARSLLLLMYGGGLIARRRQGRGARVEASPPSLRATQHDSQIGGLRLGRETRRTIRRVKALHDRQVLGACGGLRSVRFRFRAAARRVLLSFGGGVRRVLDHSPIVALGNAVPCPVDLFLVLCMQNGRGIPDPLHLVYNDRQCGHRCLGQLLRAVHHADRQLLH
mmetsp:Transcript_146675/g.381247  ORF Transcript_146675/g.381247 Transcript_146675/m.381247 type:complete len:203 (+) Transcript_146675:435-1043(+)